jgi:hypothetical protein
VERVALDLPALSQPGAPRPGGSAGLRRDDAHQRRALVGWLFPRQLVNLGFPSDPLLWYTAFGICSSAAGFFALRIVEAGLDGVGIARRVYALTCFSGMLGLVMLAVAPDANIGGADVLLVSGIAFNVTRTVSVIWVNRRTTSDVLATVHSFLDQAECTGGIIGGFALTLPPRPGGRHFDCAHRLHRRACDSLTRRPGDNISVGADDEI